MPFNRKARARGTVERNSEPIQKIAQHLHSQGACPMPYFSGWGYFSPSKRGSSTERGHWQVGEAVEGGEKSQLDGKSARARIGKGRKMPYNALICNW